MDLINILGLISSLLSIIGFIISIIKKEKARNIMLYFLLFILTLSFSILLFKYKENVDKSLNIQTRKQNMQVEATQLLEKAPSTISFFEEGQNEGVAYSLLTLLEKNKDLFPETYKAYQENVISNIKKASQEDDSYKKRKILESAGNSALQIIRSLSK